MKVAPLFVAGETPRLDPAGEAGAQAAYSRLPQLSYIDWQTSSLSAPADGNIVLSVGLPTIVRLLSTTPNVATNTGAVLDVYWRPYAQQGVPAALLNNFDNARRLHFHGPYAYLPRAGLYEIVAGSNVQGGSPFRLRAEVQHGVPPEDWIALVSDHASHSVFSQTIAVAAGGSVPVSNRYHRAFFLYRRLVIQNRSTVALSNPGIVTLGHAGFTSAIYDLPVGATLILEPEELGHHTVLLGSTSGTSFAVALSLW